MPGKGDLYLQRGCPGQVEISSFNGSVFRRKAEAMRLGVSHSWMTEWGHPCHP